MELRAFGVVGGLLVVGPIAAGLPGAADGEPRREPIVVIVPAGSATRDLGMGTLRRIFRGDIVESPEGDRFRPFNLPVGEATRTRFDTLVLGMAPHEAARYWIDRQIRGRGTSPRAISTASLLCRVVARIPGAIGYVRASQLGEGVRVIRVSGKAPGDEGYPLGSD